MVPNAMARRAPARNHPATTSPEGSPSGRRRVTLPCASRPTGLLGTTTSLSASTSAISSMTPFSTPNRTPPPIPPASVRADSVSGLESRRVSPPEASWRAMADPSPPVPMIAVLITETSKASPGVPGIRCSQWPVSGSPVTLWVCGLPHFDQITVGIANVETDLILVLFRRRQELSTPGAPFGVHGLDVLDPDIEEAANPVGITRRLQGDRRLVVSRASADLEPPLVGSH